MRESADRAACASTARCRPPSCRVSSDDPGPTSYHQWIFDNWRGVYDYKALADSLDFISYMTYAQHTGGSTPGPVAGYTWMEDVPQVHALPRRAAGEDLARHSVVLRLVVSDLRAKTCRRAHARQRHLVRESETRSRSTRSAELGRSREGSATRSGATQGVYELLWIEDARAFAAKLELVRKYKLRGYSVWVLGLEDPKVWAR